MKYTEVKETLIESAASRVVDELVEKLENDAGKELNSDTKEKISSLVSERLTNDYDGTLIRFSSRARESVYRDISRELKKDLKLEKKQKQEKT